MQSAPLHLQDLKTFEKVYTLYWKKVYGVCYAHTKNTEAAQEMVQDIFCSLWERRNSLEISGPIEHYLVRAAKLKVIDFYRQKSQKEELLGHNLTELCDHQLCIENEVYYNDASRQVNELVDRLPCQCKKVYKLSREKGMNTREISSALLISEKTVKNHLTKALNFLRENLSVYS
ncbi:RNA polymerase sigma-70 factor [Rapidithrix thailandica]|uniref:RNA polymerase sigma-70 factor n=1 Tax=Rapidithrix thailandica TaxID=413964 RepID=A0AAW9S9P8_9BACT